MSPRFNRAVLTATAVSLALLTGNAQSAEKAQTMKTMQVVKTPALKGLKGAGGATGIDLVIKSLLPPPDPVPGLPNQGYCYKWPVGGAANRVIFTIRNQGSAAAPASTAQIQFDNAGTVDAQIIALAPGQERDVEVGIPNGCYPVGYSGACTFTIRADAPNGVDESIESNNQVESLCILPAG